MRALDPEEFSGRAPRAPLIVVAWALLLAVVAGRAIMAWRHFPMFLGDQGWYLQVGLRVSRGEVLYRDVAWAYGPLPAQVLALLFRRLAADAGLATALNAILAGLFVLLTYAALRRLLPPSSALGLTAFAAIAGPYAGGDLIRLHLYTYTQAAAWGATASLAALALALSWQRRGRSGWLLGAGVAAGMAFLSKPEYGLVALGAGTAAIVAAHGGCRAWGCYLGVCAATLVVGLTWQAGAAGWGSMWRGYTGYELLREGRFWGTGRGMLRWLASVYVFGLAMLAYAAGRARPRWRGLSYLLASLAGLSVVILIAPDLLGMSGREMLAGLRAGAWPVVHVAPTVLLQWLVAAPWGLLFWVLLWAGWAVRHKGVPPAWWGLWAFALFANLRYVPTGYANGFAVAPALAALWWLAANPSLVLNTPAGLFDGKRGQRAGLLLLVALAATNLIAQMLSPATSLEPPRAWVQTSLGPIATDPLTGDEMIRLQDALRPLRPADAPIFATGWGPGWYLATGRPNPSAFDAVLAGLGTRGQDAAAIQDALARRPPVGVIVPSEQWLPAPPDATGSRYRDAAAVQSGLSAWWARLREQYDDRTPAGVQSWVLLVRR